MFHFPRPPGLYWPVPTAVLSELMSAITNKLRFAICPGYSSTYPFFSGPETLMAVYYDWNQVPTFLKILLEILNKRWQTLDVKSMMLELQRSPSGIVIANDTLSSVHRFKRKEETGLS